MEKILEHSCNFFLWRKKSYGGKKFLGKNFGKPDGKKFWEIPSYYYISLITFFSDIVLVFFRRLFKTKEGSTKNKKIKLFLEILKN